MQRSKVADERRRSLARHARDDYKRLSLQGAHKEKAAEASKARGQRQPIPPPLPPKPKNLTSGIANEQPDRLVLLKALPKSEMKREGEVYAKNNTGKGSPSLQAARAIQQITLLSNQPLMGFRAFDITSASTDFSFRDKNCEYRVQLLILTGSS